MRRANSKKLASAASTRKSIKESKQPWSTAPTPELPPAVLAQIFSQLRADDVGCAASVCSSWRDAASLEAVAWTLAMTDLDPFCALGGADGAAALFRAFGGCWLRAASVLTHGMRMRRGEKTPCQCAITDCADNAGVLCCCDPSAGTSGVERCCSKHCSGSEACVKLKGGPLYNRWVFNPKRLATVKGEYGGTLVSDDGPDDLYRVIRKNIKNGKTVHIQGDFGGKYDGLWINSPVRIVGVDGGVWPQGPHRISEFNAVDVAASLVMLENVSSSFRLGFEDKGFCCCGKCTENPDLSPAITVHNGAHLIAHNCTFSGVSGAAVMLEEGSKATLQGCTIVSHGLYAGNGTGVTVKTGAQLAMYNCKVVNERFEFASSHEDAPAVLQLAGHNTFVNEAIKHPEEDPHYHCHCQHTLECQCEPVLLCGCENEGECGCECQCDSDVFDDDGERGCGPLHHSAAAIMTKQSRMKDQDEDETQLQTHPAPKAPKLQEQQAVQEQAVPPELPPACVAAIYQFMQPRDITRCEAVTVSWREAGHMPWRPCHPAWMQNEKIPAKHRPSREWLAARCASSLRRMHEVKVEFDWTEEQISGLAHLPELRTLELSGWCTSAMTSATVKGVVDACPKISEVALLDQLLVGNSCMSAIGQLKNLHTLRLDWSGTAVNKRGLKAMGKCLSLTCLLIVGCNGGWDGSDRSCWVDVQTFELIADYLLLRGVGPKPGVTVGEWSKGFEYLERLDYMEELDLMGSGVDDSGLEHIAEGCPNLDSLTLSFCHHISPAGLWLLGELPFLRELEMSEWQGHQECGPWQDSFLDGLVDRMNRANAIEEGEEEEGEEEFNLRHLDLTSTAWFGVGVHGAHMYPGPNVLALRDAGIYIKMRYDDYYVPL
ncbi:hypothetical protein FOA52_001903 [Chlamydomonas sp. UWO 241]|nr:hypothetical protein FOA52_001903 [Chlamydomonas sp. UWO 241]